MKKTKTIKTLQAVAIAGLLTFVAAPSYAQSNNGTIGAIIGGSAGAIIGGGVDNRGSNRDGVIVGAAVGGVLGYILGSQSNDRDRQYRERYSNQRGEYYTHNGQAYRRFRDGNNGFVSIRIVDNDPYYYRDGRVRQQQKLRQQQLRKRQQQNLRAERKYHKTSTRRQTRY